MLKISINHFERKILITFEKIFEIFDKNVIIKVCDDNKL